MFFDQADFDTIRDEVMGIVDFVPTDEQIVLALKDHHELLGSAFSWGWGDTEVRSALADALVDAGLGGFLPGNRHG